MPVYLIRLSYDRSFFGIVPQKNRKTVVGEIVKNLRTKVIKFEVISRTDKFVSAKENYIKLLLNEEIKIENLDIPGIQILDIWEIEDVKIRDFVILKQYSYLIPREKLLELYFLPAYLKSVNERIWIRKPKTEFDEELLKEYAKKLKGVKPFHNFTPAKYKDYFCTIFDSYINKNSDGYVLKISGNRFLYQMIRRISSFLISISLGIFDTKYFGKVFSLKYELDPKPKTNPPYYLTLERVKLDWKNLKNFVISKIL